MQLCRHAVPFTKHISLWKGPRAEQRLQVHRHGQRSPCLAGTCNPSKDAARQVFGLVPSLLLSGGRWVLVAPFRVDRDWPSLEFQAASIQQQFPKSEVNLAWLGLVLEVSQYYVATESCFHYGPSFSSRFMGHCDISPFEFDSPRRHPCAVPKTTGESTRRCRHEVAAGGSLAEGVQLNRILAAWAY